jgi:hypothetical protein
MNLKDLKEARHSQGNIPVLTGGSEENRENIVKVTGVLSETRTEYSHIQV